MRAKILLPMLLLALLWTQAASTVCAAQCAEHQLPAHHSHAHCVARCQAMSAVGGADLKMLPACQAPACHAPACAGPICSVDLLPAMQAKFLTPTLSPALHREALAAGPTAVSPANAPGLPRRFAGAAPCTTPLRV